MGLLKESLKAIAPYGLVGLWQSQVEKRRDEKFNAKLAAFDAERRLRIASVQDKQNVRTIQGDDYEQVLEFLKGRQLDERQLREGSMSRSSLEYIREYAILQLDADRPLIALQIGNFVGVSLAFLAATLKQLHPNSLVVSIDPNLTHRGISNPQTYVSALLTACGLQANTMIIAGYSGNKSVSNDGTVFGNYDPIREFSNEFACEKSLQNLNALCSQAFDLILIDGNHDAGYMAVEIQTVLPLLRPGGFMVLDDVSKYWVEIKALFSKIAMFGLKSIGTDGRVGIAQWAKPRQEQ